jgi:hypothetical protein
MFPKRLLAGLLILFVAGVSQAQGSAWKTGEVVAVRSHEQLSTRATDAGQPEQRTGAVHLLYVRCARDVYVLEVKGDDAGPVEKLAPGKKLQIHINGENSLVSVNGRKIPVRVAEMNPAAVPRK